MKTFKDIKEMTGRDFRDSENHINKQTVKRALKGIQEVSESLSRLNWEGNKARKKKIQDAIQTSGEIQKECKRLLKEITSIR